MNEIVKTGKCINFGNCTKADNHEIIEMSITEDFICPECRRDLEGGPPPPPKPWKKILTQNVH